MREGAASTYPPVPAGGVRSAITEYVGSASVTDTDGTEVGVRALLRIKADGWWGGTLIGPADWIGIAASVEPSFALRLPDGRSGACFASDLDETLTAQRVAIAGIGYPPFG